MFSSKCTCMFNCLISIIITIIGLFLRVRQIALLSNIVMCLNKSVQRLTEIDCGHCDSVAIFYKIYNLLLSITIKKNPQILTADDISLRFLP